MKYLVSVVLLVFPVWAWAQDRVPMQDDPYLENGLRIMAQGYFMRKNCDEVSLKIFKAFGLMNSLKSRAQELGYSSDEIDAYMDDEGHKARVEAAARAELTILGLDFDDPSTICPVAKAQVQAGRGFGQYFRIR